MARVLQVCGRSRALAMIALGVAFSVKRDLGKQICFIVVMRPRQSTRLSQPSNPGNQPIDYSRAIPTINELTDARKSIQATRYIMFYLFKVILISAAVDLDH